MVFNIIQWDGLKPPPPYRKNDWISGLEDFLMPTMFLQTHLRGEEISIRLFSESMSKKKTSTLNHTAKGTYLYISKTALTIAQTTQNNWVMGVKVKHEFTGDILYLNSDIHPRSKTLILNSGFIILIFKFCPVKLYMRGKIF